MGSCPGLGLFLFPVDRDPHDSFFFCSLQSNVFDAARLFQINHVVHRNVPRAWGHFSCEASGLSCSYYVMFTLYMFIFKGKAYCGFCLPQNCQHGLFLSAAQDKFGIFSASKSPGKLSESYTAPWATLAWIPPFLNKKRMLLSLSLLLWINITKCKKVRRPLQPHLVHQIRCHEGGKKKCGCRGVLGRFIGILIQENIQLGHHPQTQTMQTASRADCEDCADWVIFLVIADISFTFGSHMYWLWSQISVHYISKCLLYTGRASLVCDCWCVIDFLRETPFSTKYA